MYFRRVSDISDIDLPPLEPLFGPHLYFHPEEETTPGQFFFKPGIRIRQIIRENQFILLSNDGLLLIYFHIVIFYFVAFLGRSVVKRSDTIYIKSNYW